MDPVGYRRANRHFHDVIAGMSGNPILDVITQGLVSIYNERIQMSHFPRHSRERVLEEHSAIAEAIKAGDETKAEALMKTHMREWFEMAQTRFPGLLEEPVDWA
jgi:DNA-binding FadR family transcriptional regulator